METKSFRFSKLMLMLFLLGFLILPFYVGDSAWQSIEAAKSSGDIMFTDNPGNVNSLLSTPPLSEWNKTYGGANYDRANSMVKTSDGGYVLAGETSSSSAGWADFWLVKTDAVGNLQWSKTYGGTRPDVAWSVVQTSDGGLAIAGDTYSYGSGDRDFWLVKVDSFGNHQWNKTYGGINSGNTAYSVIQSSDGGYALAGHIWSSGSFNFWLVKTDSTGNMQWNKTYGGANEDVALCVLESSDGGYALAGSTESFGAGFGDFWLVKTDAVGNMIWSKTFGGSDWDCARSIIRTSDGGYAMAGETKSYGARGSNFWLVKTGSTGNMQWNKTYGTDYEDYAFSIVKTTDGGYALAGKTEAGYSDFRLIKVDSSGNQQWSQTYGGPDYDDAFSIVETTDGGYAMAGLTKSYGVGDYDAWLVKVAGIHDVAVTAITASKNIIGQGYMLSLIVAVENQGGYTENFNVTVYANAISINTTKVTLTSGSSQIIAFNWNTTGFAKGNYTISAYAIPVPGETDTTDNTFISAITVKVVMVGDVDANGKVEIKDFSLMAKGYGANYPDPKYVADLDIDGNGKIEIKDFSIAAKNYGKIDP